MSATACACSMPGCICNPVTRRTKTQRVLILLVLRSQLVKFFTTANEYQHYEFLAVRGSLCVCVCVWCDVCENSCGAWHESMSALSPQHCVIGAVMADTPHVTGWRRLSTECSQATAATFLRQERWVSRQLTYWSRSCEILTRLTCVHEKLTCTSQPFDCELGTHLRWMMAMSFLMSVRNEHGLL